MIDIQTVSIVVGVVVGVVTLLIEALDSSLANRNSIKKIKLHSIRGRLSSSCRSIMTSARRSSSTNLQIFTWRWLASGKRYETMR